MFPICGVLNCIFCGCVSITFDGYTHHSLIFPSKDAHVIRSLALLDSLNMIWKQVSQLVCFEFDESLISVRLFFILSLVIHSYLEILAVRCCGTAAAAVYNVMNQECLKKRIKVVHSKRLPSSFLVRLYLWHKKSSSHCFVVL